MNTSTNVTLAIEIYSIKNIGYLYRLVRVSRRISMAAASDMTGLCENSIRDFESGDLKEGSIKTLARLSLAYKFETPQLIFTNLPSDDDRNEVYMKGIELGNELRCKSTPVPGTRAAKELDEKWLQWGKVLLDRFYERIRLK